MAEAEAEYNAAVKAKGEAQKMAREAQNGNMKTVNEALVAKRLSDANERYKKGRKSIIFKIYENPPFCGGSKCTKFGP